MVTKHPPNKAILPCVGDYAEDGYGSIRRIVSIQSQVKVTYTRDVANPREITLDEWHALTDSCEHDKAMRSDAHDVGA